MDNNENNFGVGDESGKNDDDSDIAVFDDFSYDDAPDDGDDLNYPYHTKEEVSADKVKVGRSILDFAREAEEEERLEREQSAVKPKSNLDDVEVCADMISDMDYNGKHETSGALRRQMELDDIAMEMGRNPVLSEMSDIYTTKKQKKSDLSEKDVLDRDEKLLMKERLESEISKRPENFNKRQSAAMYHALMEEQEMKRARKGFGCLFVIILLGIASAVITFMKLNWNESELFMYLAAGAAFFSVLLFIKLKAVKVLSCLYFAANTVLLLGPGAVKYMMDPAPKPGGYLETLIFYIAAIALSAIVCIALATNMDIDAYYSTRMRKSRKQQTERKPAVRTVKRK